MLPLNQKWLASFLWRIILMNDPVKNKVDWKKKLRHEFVEYGINVCYLSLVFAALVCYRRLLLAAHDVTYTNYGFALIEAFVLGKVILIGSLMRLDRGLESKPLILSTLFRTVVFTVFVAGFKIIEHGVVGLFRKGDFMAGVGEVFGKGQHEILANTLMLFVALLPFFAFKELERVLGRDQIRSLFFWRKVGATIPPQAEP
jgi:hypothetical protein